MIKKLLPWLFFLLLLLVILAGLNTGPSEVNVWNVFDKESTPMEKTIVIHRFNRILTAFLVGGALALAGYLQQLLVNNPLADPFILGTASGASLGANFAYMVLPVVAANAFFPSVFAFAGALLVTFIAFIIGAGKGGNIYPSRLLLAGIALSSFALALNSLMIFASGTRDTVTQVVFWSMGNLELGSPSQVSLLAVFLIFALLSLIFYYKHLNILILGKERGEMLGLNVKRARWIALLVSSLLTALAVAVAGPVGFVGLVVPHVIRAAFGVHGRWNLFYTVLTGGTFLLFCDLASRWILKYEIIPVGIITSFLGIPFFIYLLFKSKYRFG